jgi:predicted transcriptional regulator
MNKPTEKTVVVNNFRLNTEIKKKLEEIAEREQRTFAGQIRLALQEWIENKSARPGRGGRKRT